MKEFVISLEEKRIATAVYVSPAGSVGASASQRCPPDTRTAMTRVGETDYRAPFGFEFFVNVNYSK